MPPSLKSQRILLNLLSLMALIGAVALVALNANLSIPFDFGWEVLPSIPLGLSLGLVGVLSALAVFFKMWEQLLLSKHGVRKSERLLEKVEVQAEASTDRMKALEAKIQTLEKALEEALKRASGRK